MPSFYEFFAGGGMARAPKANAEYWSSKIGRNHARDVVHIAAA